MTAAIEAVAVGKRRPAGADIVSGRRLCAAVEYDNKGRFRLELERQIGEHPKMSGI